MAKRPLVDDDAIPCPLGCGEMLLPGAEHTCSEVLVDDADHLHDFTTDKCPCGITVEQAVAISADEMLADDVPSASTACLKCDAPITEVQRKTSGTCESCLAEGALHTARPSLVVVAPPFIETEAREPDAIHLRALRAIADLEAAIALPARA